MSIDKWMDKEVVVHLHNGILLSHKKEHIWVSSNEVDEPRTYYTEWSKSEREKQILYTNAYTRASLVAQRLKRLPAEKATWVTNSSTGATWENLATVLTLAGSAQTSMVWSRNRATIRAASVSSRMPRTSASLSYTNRTSLNGRNTSTLCSTSALCRNSTSSLYIKEKL